ncbi:MAG: hypothetical protein EOO46_01305 [Flavobacterium sp.]|nr:MAG: hypothetical protein EOO46_01305 [Flavobacterium sp.]
MELQPFQRDNYITQTEAAKAYKMSIAAFKALVAGLDAIERKNRIMGTYKVDIKYYLKADFLERLEMNKKKALGN